MESAPVPLEVQEFQFKLHCKLKVLPKLESSLLLKNPNLVCVANRYGLVFIANKNELQVLKTDQLIMHNDAKNEINTYIHRKVSIASTIIADFKNVINTSGHRTMNTASMIVYVAVNSDNTLLAVVVEKNGCLMAAIYSVTSFLSENIVVTNQIRLSATPNTYLLDICWNPGVPNIIAACLSDGSVSVFELKPNGVELNSLPPESQSKCLCWSPKGKQIVIGSANGSLAQYKPDLKIVKTYPAPPINNSGNCTIQNVTWISNYQFIGVFKDTQDKNSRPALIVVNTSKTGQISYVNFDDICYSSSDLRPHRFFLIYQPVWNIIIASSVNSVEVGVLGILDGSDGTAWQQWIQSDESRAELPLSNSKEETYPVGFALDTSATHQLPWGENQTLHPMPLLYILSSEGILNVFNVINIRQNAPSICTPPQAIGNQSGLALFKNEQSVKFDVASNPVQTQALSPISQQNVSSSPVAAQQNIFSTVVTQKNILPTAAAQQNILSAQQNILPTQQNVLPTQPNLLPAQQNILPNIVPSSQIVLPTFVPPQNTLSSIALQQKTLPVINKNMFSFSPATSTPISEKNVNQQVPFAIPKFTPTIEKTPMASTVPSKMFDIKTYSNINVTKAETPKKEISIVPNVPEKTESFEVVEDTTSRENSSVIQSLITAEIKTFESEIENLLIRCKHINTQVGTDEEKTILVEKCSNLEQFFNELNETTETQSAEIHSLKQLLIEGFALQEESRSRYKRLSNPQYAELIKIHEVDPVSNKKVAEIKSLMYYVETQLNQANRSLDELWSDFQDSCRKDSKAIYQTPTLGAVYQSMIKQNEIIKRQNFVLKDLKARIKSHNRKQNKLSLLSNVSKDDPLNQVTNSLKNIYLDKGKNSSDILEAKYKAIEEKQSKITVIKEEKLKTLLISNKVARLTPNKPTNRLSSSKLLSKISSNKLNMLEKTKCTEIGKVTSLAVAETTPLAITKIINDEIKGKMHANRKLFEDVTPPSTPLKDISIEQKKTFEISNTMTPSTVKSTDFSYSVPFSKTIKPFEKIELTPPTSTKSSISSMLMNTSKPVLQNSGKEQTNEKLTTSSTAFIKTTTFNFISPSATITVAQTTNTFSCVTTASNVVTPISKIPVATTAQINTLNVAASQNTASTFSFAQPTVTSSFSFVPTTTKSIFSGFAPISTSATSTTSFSSNLGIFSKTTSVPSLFSQTTSTTNTNSPSVAVTSAVFGGVTSPVDTSVSNTTKISESEKNTSITNVSSQSSSPFIQKTSTSLPIFGVNSFNSSVSPHTGGSIFGGFSATTFATTVSSTTTSVTTTTASIFGTSTNASGNVSGTVPASIHGTVAANAAGTIPVSITGSISTSVSGLTNIPGSTSPSVSEAAPISILGSVPTSIPGTVSISTPGATSTSETTIETINVPDEITETTSATNISQSNIINQQTVGPVNVSTPDKILSVSAIPNATSFNATPIITTNQITFGTPTVTTQSAFAPTSIAAQTSPFGKTTTATTTSQNLFATNTSIFGTPTTQSSSFGFGNLTVSALSPQATNTSSVPPTTNTFSFVNPSANTVQSPQNNAYTFRPNIFGQTPSTTASQNTFMGSQICSPSPFVQTTTQQSNNIFAPKDNQTSTSIFGAKTSTASIFGSSSNTSAVSSGSMFAKPATGSIFGQQNTSIFGAKSTFGQASVFGQPATFGSNQTNIFGNSTNTNTSTFGSNPSSNLFSAPQTGSTFGSPNQSLTGGSFSSSAQSISQSGFGSPSSFQKPASGFGSPPVFGSSPVQPAFGSPPTFGGSPTFATKIFTSPSSVQTNAMSFGSVQQNATFANLANQNTVGFGNLAQSQSSTLPQTPQFSGNNAFSSWRQ